MSLDSLKEIAEKCVRCGMCQSVCPVFAELQKEAAVARGKVTLIAKLLSKEIGHSQKLSTYLLQCLGCGACSENCPNGVKADELILESRALMVEEKGLSLPKWLILRKVLTSRHLLSMLLKTGSLAQALISRKVPKESGLHLRFSLPYLDKNRLIPSIANPFLLDRHPDGIEVKDGRKKVGLFAGCSINYLFPSIGESTIRLLTRNRCSVGIPKDQICCGLPAYGSGDMETARSLARRNIRAFSHPDIDQILVPCASCFYFLKEGYLKLFPGEEEAQSFSKKVVEPSTFFSDLIDFSHQDDGRLDQNQKLRLTYHDPCHLRRRMKIYREPRQLLKSLPGIEFVEMKQPNRCCGMAGSFNLIYYDLSQKIVQRKVEDVKSTKANVVTTSCMGCMIQLKDGLYQNGLETKVVHLVEVLERALNPSHSGLQEPNL
jgi:glycolate oxidase iron-sulfur subunit